MHGLWRKDILAGKSGGSRSCPLPEVLCAPLSFWTLADFTLADWECQS